MESGGITRSLSTLLVVVIVLVGFAAFFISFLVAPLIVMVISYALLSLLDRRRTPAGLPGRPDEQQPSAPESDARSTAEPAEAPAERVEVPAERANVSGD